MKNRYFYEANCRIYITAKNEDHAEQMIMNTDLNAYIIDECLYEIDEDYIAVDLNKRKEKMGTHFHPMDDPEKYEDFRRQVRRYGKIFREFLNGKIDRNQMIKRMDQAEGTEIDDGSLIYQVKMVDFETKEGKTAKLVTVD